MTKIANTWINWIRWLRSWQKKTHIKCQMGSSDVPYSALYWHWPRLTLFDTYWPTYSEKHYPYRNHWEPYLLPWTVMVICHKISNISIKMWKCNSPLWWMVLKSTIELINYNLKSKDGGFKWNLDRINQTLCWWGHRLMMICFSIDH